MGLYLILIGQSWHSEVSYFQSSMALLYISEWYLSISSWITEINDSSLLLSLRVPLDDDEWGFA